MLYSSVRDDGVTGILVDRLDSTCTGDDLASGTPERFRSSVCCRVFGGGGEPKDVDGTTVFTSSNSSPGTP
jgi:hypothetical protein